MTENNNFLIIHSLDNTTKFLLPFQENFPYSYIALENNDERSKYDITNKISLQEEDSTIVFLGHGTTLGLFAPEENLFIDRGIGDSIFSNKNILLLSCKSNQFIKTLNTYKQAIGFGNIRSSKEEIPYEDKCKLTEDDIERFNNTYVNAIIKSLEILLAGKISFSELPKRIEFYINKEINDILLDKDKKNRRELSKLLFEFKNEMVYLKK